MTVNLPTTIQPVPVEITYANCSALFSHMGRDAPELRQILDAMIVGQIYWVDWVGVIYYICHFSRRPNIGHNHKWDSILQSDFDKSPVYYWHMCAGIPDDIP